MVIISDPGSQGYPKIGNYTIPFGNREKPGKDCIIAAKKGCVLSIFCLLNIFFSRFALLVLFFGGNLLLV